MWKTFLAETDKNCPKAVSIDHPCTWSLPAVTAKCLVLFGEGVINDAVAILLFKAIENVINSGGQNDSLGKDQIVKMIFEFIYLASSSLFLGIFFGLMASYMLKKVELNENPVK